MNRNPATWCCELARTTPAAAAGKYLVPTMRVLVTKRVKQECVVIDDGQELQ